MNGQPANDFIYCFIGIGLVEEFIKILPVVLLLIFTIKKCDPIEILIYASASALGFAFIENIIYFSDSLEVVSGRAFTATILHMVLSSVIAYLFIYFRYRKGKKAWLALLPGLFIAAFLHGFYDFWLLNKSVSILFFLSLIFMVISVFVWTIMINNSLNVSPLFVSDKPFEVSKASILLMSGLSSVFIIEFILTSVNVGPTYANESIKYSMLGGGYMLIILSTNLCKIDLVKGSWEKISLVPFRKMLNIDNLKHMSIILTPGAQAILPKASYPLKATISKKLALNGEKNWFLIQLKWPVKINDDSVYNAIVKVIHPDKTFSDENVSVKIIYIKNLSALENEKISGEHLRHAEVLRCNEWIED